MERSQSFSEIKDIDIKIIEIKQPQNYEQQLKQQKTIFQQSFALQTIFDTPKKQFQNIMMGNTCIKSGIVQIRLNGNSFKKSQLLLTREKMIIDQTQVYSLKYLQCKIYLVSKNSFKLFKVEFKENSIFTIKCFDEIDGKLWFQCFQMINERFSFNIQKLFIPQSYFGIDFIKEEEFLQVVETGDIVLFETNHYMAKLQRGITGSNYDHVGMIVRGNCDGEVLLFDVKNQTGVDFEYWGYYMKQNELFKRVAFRKLLNVNNKEIELKIKEFADKTQGQHYELNVGKLLQFQSNGLVNRGYFCSELIAKAYKYSGLLPQNKASTQYWPVTFSKPMKLLDGAILGEPITILLERDVQQYQL